MGESPGAFGSHTSRRREVPIAGSPATGVGRGGAAVERNGSKKAEGNLPFSRHQRMKKKIKLHPPIRWKGIPCHEARVDASVLTSKYGEVPVQTVGDLAKIMAKARPEYFSVSGCMTGSYSWGTSYWGSYNGFQWKSIG